MHTLVNMSFSGMQPELLENHVSSCIVLCATSISCSLGDGKLYKNEVKLTACIYTIKPPNLDYSTMAIICYEHD